MNNTDDNEELDGFAEGSSNMEEPSSLVVRPEVEAKLEQIIEAVPADKKESVRHTFQEFFALIERSSSPHLSPEVARIMVESADRDNENKFKFLTQKQQDDAELEKEELGFRKQKHKDRFSLVKPIIYFVLAFVAILTGLGIYLCVIGKEVLGASLLTGIFSAIFGYLAGVGTSDFFKDETRA